MEEFLGELFLQRNLVRGRCRRLLLRLGLSSEGGFNSEDYDFGLWRILIGFRGSLSTRSSV
jgi:hypothetical protein